MQDELGRPVLALASCAEGLFEAGIIYVPTSSADPVFFATELGEGTFLASMGTPRELDASVYLAADDIVVSYKPTFLFSKEDIGQLIDLDRMGEVNWENDVDELSAILSGKDSVNPAQNVGRSSEPFRAGFDDMTICLAAYQKCLEEGRGTRVDLGSHERL